MGTISSSIVRSARALLKARGFSITIVAILATGIGVTTAIFALVDAVLIRALPYPEADRLVAVRHAASRTELPMTGLSSGTFLHYRAQNRVFEDVAAYRESVYTVLDPGEPERVRIASVSPTFFGVLRTRPFLGRFPSETDYQFRVRTGLLISHDLWVRRYGADPGIVGKTVRIEGNPASNVVVGVAEPGFHFPDPETQIWIAEPQEGRPTSNRAAVRGLFLKGVARLKPGVAPHDAELELQRLIRTWPDAFPDITTQQIEQMGLRAVVVPLKDAVIGDVRVPLLLLLTTAAFLLLITWANATNLSLVRAERLRRDVAVARALGATDRHLVERFFGESALLATSGGVLGVLLATAAVAGRFGFDPDQIPRLREVHMDARVVILAIGLSAVSGFLLGSAAFLNTRQSSLGGALTGALTRVTGSRREQRGRRVLVVAQIALALPLLIGSALMVRSFWRLLHVNLGFRPQGAITFTLPVPPTKSASGDFYHGTARVHDEVLRGLRALPGVGAAEATTVFPLTVREGYGEERITAAGRPAETGTAFTLWSFATMGYFRAMGIPMLEGREFQPDDMSLRSPGVILSASLARTLFGPDDPIGRQVQRAGTSAFPPYTVVGVVGDIPADTIAGGASKVLYFANVYPPKADVVTGAITDYIPDTQVYVVRTNMPLASLAPAIQRAVHDVSPKLAVTRLASVDQRVADSMARPRLTMVLLLAGAATAVFLGVVGLYGVLAYTVSLRTRELGVRIALGESPAHVTRGVLREGAQLALAGIGGGLVAGVALTRFLGTLLYQVKPSDPAGFAAMSVVLFAVVLAASYLPARRAGRVNPIQALKAE